MFKNLEINEELKTITKKKIGETNQTTWKI